MISSERQRRIEAVVSRKANRGWRSAGGAFESLLYRHLATDAVVHVLACRSAISAQGAIRGGGAAIDGTKRVGRRFVSLSFFPLNGRYTIDSSGDCRCVVIRTDRLRFELRHRWTLTGGVVPRVRPSFQPYAYVHAFPISTSARDLRRPLRRPSSFWWLGLCSYRSRRVMKGFLFAMGM